MIFPHNSISSWPKSKPKIGIYMYVTSSLSQAPCNFFHMMACPLYTYSMVPILFCGYRPHLMIYFDQILYFVWWLVACFRRKIGWWHRQRSAVATGWSCWRFCVFYSFQTIWNWFEFFFIFSVRFYLFNFLW